MEERSKALPVEVLDLIFQDAFEREASEIHIERSEKEMKTKFRIDGVLKEMAPPPAKIHKAITSRIKILAKLDTIEKERPQEGSFRLNMEGKEYNLRVSITPHANGESILIRI